MSLELIVISLTNAFFSYLNRRPSPSNEIQSNNPVLAEYTEKYNEHLKGLFDVIIQNSNTLFDKSNYFGGLRRTTEKKRMILQHFITNELISQKYSKISVMYQTAVLLLNDLKEERDKALIETSKFDGDLRNFNFEGRLDGNWIQYSDLRSAMGIKKVDLIEDATNKSLDLGYGFSDSIYFNFFIFEDKEKNEWLLGLKNNHFAGSKNKENIEELKTFIYEQGQSRWNLVYDYKSKKDTINSFLVHYLYLFTSCLEK